MIYLYSTLLILICFLTFLNMYRFWFVNEARRRGKLPPKGKATIIPPYVKLFIHASVCMFLLVYVWEPGLRLFSVECL